MRVGALGPRGSAKPRKWPINGRPTWRLICRLASRQLDFCAFCLFLNVSAVLSTLTLYTFYFVFIINRLVPFRCFNWLSEGFDCVAIVHEILFHKREGYRIKQSLKRFKSLLGNWPQSTLCSFCSFTSRIYRSKREIINLGVPKGSVLGPSLFNVYSNDMQKCMKGINDLIVVSYDYDKNFVTEVLRKKYTWRRVNGRCIIKTNCISWILMFLTTGLVS